MIVLGLETSSQAASCALTVDGKLFGEYFINAGLTHSQTIMPMVESLLHSVGMEASAVDVLAVSTGPGSFTGLRIGLSAVKGMAMALDKPCAGVSTLHGLAVNGLPFQGYMIPVLDARRAQVYTAVFESTGDGLARRTEDAAIAIQELKERLQDLKGPKLLVGDGAALCKESLPEIEMLYTAPAHSRYQRAASVCAVAEELAKAGKLVTADALVPSYLRLPQAERELRAKQAAE